MANDKDIQSRIDAAVELLKQAAPQMLAQKGPLDTSPEISREESPDAVLCDFYDANSWTELVRELVNHVEQLQETVKRNVKPWEDTFPPTLLPAFIERIKQADTAARATLSANSPVIPYGWRLVPIEPTEEMVINGFESEPDKFFSSDDEWEAYAAMSGCEQAAHRARLCYSAMLAVAPQPEGGEA
ncbi:hypothetical protein [Dickeya oryzae]